MNFRLFRQDRAHERLIERYRIAEEGAGLEADTPDVSFAGDYALISALARLAASETPPDVSPDRARLLALVERRQKKPAISRGGLVHMPHLPSVRAAALVGAAAIFLGGAVTVGASGGVSDAAGNVEDVLAALNITDRTPDEADEHLDAIEENGDGNGGSQNEGPRSGLDTAAENADENAEHGLDNAEEGADNAGQGIENASDQGLEQASDNAIDGPESDGVPADGEQFGPELPDEASDTAEEHTEDAGPPEAVPPAP